MSPCHFGGPLVVLTWSQVNYPVRIRPFVADTNELLGGLISSCFCVFTVHLACLLWCGE